MKKKAGGFCQAAGMCVFETGLGIFFLYKINRDLGIPHFL